jgi:hypothetical protein
MKHSVIVLVAMLFLVGCQTHTQQTEVVQPLVKDKRLAAIYEDLKTVPIPTPKATPFDGDSRRRDAYLAGFREGWDFAISGRILYGTMIGPAGMESDLFSVWQDGAREGSRLGSEQLMARLDVKR